MFEDKNNQLYNPNETNPYSTTEIQPAIVEADKNSTSLNWKANEFIEHEKKAHWYVLLFLITVALATVVYFALNNDVFAPVIILILGVVFGIAGSRKPHILEYSLSENGINAGSRYYSYEEFKSFCIENERGVSTIQLMPVKRLSPVLTLYPPEVMLDEIVEYMGYFLPIEQPKLNYIDDFLKKIRF